jgi:hypothetical protein
MLINGDSVNSASVNSTSSNPTGDAECPLQINVDYLIDFSGGTASCPMLIRVTQIGDAECPLEINVDNPTGDAECPLQIKVGQTGTAECPLQINVSDEGAVWSFKVVLDGVDISDSVTDEIVVEIEEGVARIADVVIVVGAGSVPLFDWVGSSITIDYIEITNGSELPYRLFTGKVHIPDYDPIGRTVSLHCSDSLQMRLAAMSREEILSITGGKYSESVQGEKLNNWDFAKAVMETLPASLDCGPYGEFRVTPWHTTTVYREFGDGEWLPKNLKLDPARREDIINKVTCSFGYRYTRLHRRTLSLSWAVSVRDVVDNGLPVPGRDMIRAAVESTGWEQAQVTGSMTFRSSASDSINFTPFPTSVPIGTNGVWVNNSPDSSCMAFNTRLVKRFAQTVTEEATFIVTAPESIAKHGVMPIEMSGTLESNWDATDWEGNMTIPPLLNNASVKTETVDYAPDIATGVRDTAMEVIIDSAKVAILASNRTGRVHVPLVPLRPSVDVNRRLRFTSPFVTVSGKAAKVIHRMQVGETSDGEGATTYVSLAVSGHGAVGEPTPPDTPTTVPDDPTPPAVPTSVKNQLTSHLRTYIGAMDNSPSYSDTWQGWIVNVPRAFNVIDQGGNSYQYNAQTQQTSQRDYAGAVLNPAYNEDTAFPTEGFRIITPEVDSASRDAYTSTTEENFTVPIPVDEFDV